MKKIFTFFLSTLMGCSLYAQESADRLVIFDKAQNQKSFLVERIDSIQFKKIEGVVAADIKVLDITHEKFHFEVLRTPACRAFKLLIVPKVIANHLTNDDVMASYVDEKTQQMYFVLHCCPDGRPIWILVSSGSSTYPSVARIFFFRLLLKNSIN